ncbi:hypothetical protein [Bartonella krasnovii]|uniref:hypothetical protein n=1 Tax=Bartonella krasnovii TaxID=2267275 RepID=UPI000E769FAA|nr:hypothetical protein [Bartonella krasnovii]UNF39392.1 hypothetical protein MNL10_02825 [Bartonella krasnovii]UNF50937.1 hypothetical protein MNL03_02825 [Bartonella krasnovii]
MWIKTIKDKNTYAFYESFQVLRTVIILEAGKVCDGVGLRYIFMGFALKKYLLAQAIPIS